MGNPQSDTIMAQVQELTDPILERYQKDEIEFNDAKEEIKDVLEQAGHEAVTYYVLCALVCLRELKEE